MLSIDRVWEWDYCLVQDFFKFSWKPQGFLESTKEA